MTQSNYYARMKENKVEMMKVDTAITCDGVYGIKAERGELQVQLVGIRLDSFIEDNREAIEAYLAAQKKDHSE